MRVAVVALSCLAIVLGAAAVTAFDPASASYLTVLQESWERDGLGRLAGAATCALAVAAVVLVSSARGGDANSTAEMRLRRALSDPLIVSWIAQSQRSQKTSDSVAELSLAVPAAAVAAADFAQFDTHIKNFDLDCASQVLESIPRDERRRIFVPRGGARDGTRRAMRR